MSDKRPQSTATLTKRLRRVAKWIDQLVVDDEAEVPKLKARANTCLQAAGRLQDLVSTADGQVYETGLRAEADSGNDEDL